MSFTNLYKDRTKPTISFEFFPARDDAAYEKQCKVIDNLVSLQPNFVSSTFGAGGSTYQGSYELVKKLMSYKNVKVVAYFAAYGLGPDTIIRFLNGYKELGVETILCVRGDEPQEDPDFTPHPECFQHTTELLPFVRERFDFCTGIAGYPEGHKEAVSFEEDIQFLRQKVENGAEYIIAQYCYDTTRFFDFVAKCRESGVNVPIIAGVMPIYSVKMMNWLTSLCGVTVTDEIREKLAKIPNDDKKAIADFGIEFAADQCRTLIKGGAQGLHFFTMNRGKSVKEVITRLKDEGLL
jgi:methylenetetrahydrofolate reductase (NADPH)